MKGERTAWFAVMLGFAIVGLCGCGYSRELELKIGRRIERCPANAECIFALEEVTDFEWDRFYAFDLGTQQIDRERAMGVRDPDYGDLMRQFVFLKAGRIVYQETPPTDVEKPVQGEVAFEFPSNLRYGVYDRGALFLASKQPFEDGIYYVLKQVK